MTERIWTAALVVIGDEILSGRTHDKNVAQIAVWLNVQGIRLAEVRVVADRTEAIVEAVNTLRARNDYLFTTGGIGPTHDDITADAVSKAFGVPCLHDAEAMRLLGEMYERRNMEFTEARQRMARMPKGSRHIPNPVSVAPGFIIGNVHVMAGVPQVFQAMLDSVVSTLPAGAKVLSRSIACPFGEGDIGTLLGAVQKAHPETSIGSYPHFDGQRFSTELVVRARDAAALEAAARDVVAMIDALTAEREGQRAKDLGTGELA